jgi:hypothetical protein
MGEPGACVPKKGGITVVNNEKDGECASTIEC